MTKTTFWATAELQDHLAAAYMANPAGPAAPALAIDDSAGQSAVALSSVPLSAPAALSGGGRLNWYVADYFRFAEMLRKGGQLDGQRLLSPRTVAYMVRNHLPGGTDLEHFGSPRFAETTFDGIGFGLGFSVVTDPAAGKVLTSCGEFGGGAFSTVFWVAPEEDLTVMSSLSCCLRAPSRSEAN